MAPRRPRCFKGLKWGEQRRHLSLGEPRQERWQNRLASPGRKRLPKCAADCGRRIEAPTVAPSRNCNSHDAGSSLNLASCGRAAVSHMGDFVVMAGITGIKPVHKSESLWVTRENDLWEMDQTRTQIRFPTDPRVRVTRSRWLGVMGKLTSSSSSSFNLIIILLIGIGYW